MYKKRMHDALGQCVLLCLMNFLSQKQNTKKQECLTGDSLGNRDARWISTVVQLSTDPYVVFLFGELCNVAGKLQAVHLKY